MASKHSHSPVFKPYEQQQLLLLPPSLEELIAANHPARIVNTVLNKIDSRPLLSEYCGGGSSSYHPLALLKLVVYGYMTNVYSSRKLEEAAQQNIVFMWLCGMNTPDHNTINNFRGKKLQGPLKSIFVETVKLLAEEGLLSIKDIFSDGTKMEADANRYTFVWGKGIKTNKEKMASQLEKLWAYAQSVTDKEMEDTVPTNFADIDSAKVKSTIEKIDAALKDKPVSKQVKQRLDNARKKWPDALDRYAEQEAIMGENRNSYSKTDNDATFMRMKEDHMGNGQLKPAYNMQISTSNQFVTNYTIHQNATDTNTLKGHLDEHKRCYEQMPEILTTDAGYGSEENYEYLEKEQVTAYVKYSHFDREQHEAIQQKHPFTADKLFYNAKEDCYVCPMGQRMVNKGSYTKQTTTGFKQTITKYQAQDCSRCPLNGACHKSQGNRVIEVNHNLNRHKRDASENLKSEEGLEHRKKRCHDVEPVFGNIKANHGFKRFMLRGMEKVTTETGLLCLAQNFRKKGAIELKKAA